MSVLLRQPVHHHPAGGEDDAAHVAYLHPAGQADSALGEDVSTLDNIFPFRCASLREGIKVEKIKRNGNFLEPPRLNGNNDKFLNIFFAFLISGQLSHLIIFKINGK